MSVAVVDRGSHLERTVVFEEESIKDRCTFIKIKLTRRTNFSNLFLE